MTFEGQTKVLPIKGIERAGADNLCEDGAMNEVVGLEYKDGSYVPYAGKETQRASLNSFISSHANETVKAIYVHKTSSGTNVILMSEQEVIGGDDIQRLYWMTQDNFNASTASSWNQFAGITHISSVEFVGNMICISTFEKVAYYLWKNINNTWGYYYYQTEEIPINVMLSVDRGIISDNTQGAYCMSKNKSNVSLSSTDVFIELLTAVESLVKEHGAFTGCFLATYGFRTKAGKIVNVAPLVMFNFPDVINGQDNAIANSQEETIYVRNSVQYFAGTDEMEVNQDLHNQYLTLTYRDGSTTTTSPIYRPTRLYASGSRANGSYAVAEAIGNVLKVQISTSGTVNDEIDSVCIFISKQISPYKNYALNKVLVPAIGVVDNTYATIQNVGNYVQYLPKYKTMADFTKELKEIDTLYLAKEIYIKDFQSYAVPTTIDLRSVLSANGANLYTQEQLHISDIIEYKYSNGLLDAYNGRLHVYDFERRLLHNINLKNILYYNQTGSGQYQPDYSIFYKYEIDVYIKNEYDNDMIDTFWSDTDIGTNSVFPCFMYPNHNAYKVIVRKASTNGSSYNVIEKEFLLTSIEELGVAYYIGNSFEPIQIIGTQTTKSMPVVSAPDLFYNYGKNELIVSETQLPYVFEKDKAYTIGNGTILKLARLSTSLSQDSFGRYPLLAFCTDGIYSLNVDTDGGAYTNITPFSREVCVNPNTICEIDGAVIFASDKGIMVATEKGVEAFNIILNGVPRNLPQSSKNSYGLGLYKYGEILSTAGTVNLWSTSDAKAISKEDFIDYLKDDDTFVSYVSMKNKLIVYNKNRQFIYWIDIPTRNATKLYSRICFDNNDYPTEKYYQIDTANATREITFDYRSKHVSNTTYSVPTMFQTRPIKIANGLKGVFRIVLRGYFNNGEQWYVGQEGTLQPYWAELLVLGSYNGINWFPIGIKEKSLYGGFHDLGCETDRVSVNYIMICFSASLAPENIVTEVSTQQKIGTGIEGSHIDSIEITLESRDDNKR